MVVVGAGPSLEKNQKHLHRADIIVSTLRAAPLVKAAGYTPDLVVAAGFRGYFIPKNLPRSPYLIDLRTHPVVVDSIPGQLLIAQTDWDSSLDLPGPYICGASTSLAALDMAAVMGASRISLPGWDILDSPTGTPGKILHRSGLQRFQHRFPDIKIVNSFSRHKVRYSDKVRNAVRMAKIPVSWLSRLSSLSKNRHRWNPFWGPDYSLLKISGRRMDMLVKYQRAEEVRVAEIFRLKGYA